MPHGEEVVRETPEGFPRKRRHALALPGDRLAPSSGHLPAASAELSRPAFYADAWGGIHPGWPENGAWPEEQRMAAGMAPGVYADLGQKTSASQPVSPFWISGGVFLGAAARF